MNTDRIEASSQTPLVDKRLNILAIGAHPDDAELGCGGLLLKAARRGHNVFLYNVTRGSASGDPQERARESIESSKFIGARALWMDNFEDATLSSSDAELVSHIEFFTNKCNADIVYTHSPVDNHHDHRAVAEATVEGARHAPNILSYEMPVTKNFNPQIYYDISDVIEDKIELINIFVSQKNKMFIKSHAIKGLAQYRALQSRLNVAHAVTAAVESFEVMKLSLENDFKLTRGLQDHITSYALEHRPKDVIEYLPSAGGTSSPHSTEPLSIGQTMLRKKLNQK